MHHGFMSGRNLINPKTWQQILERDCAARFFYGVTTTGIFCRPACPARRPLRANLRIFATDGEARQAGYRPCLRCRPESPEQSRDEKITFMLRMIEACPGRSLSLAELGRKTGMSAFSAQKKFKAAMGVSPLAYKNALRARQLRAQLRKGESVIDSIYASGYGASSRAYEANTLGMTPTRFAAGGRGEVIRHYEEKSAFGWLIVGSTARGLCWLALADSKHGAVQSLQVEFPAAVLKRDAALGESMRAAIAAIETGKMTDLPLDLRGTAFQLRVWNALRKIPRGRTCTYGELAKKMGIPKSTRAVARACATNRVALLVPCHRIIGADGALTGYRWGVERKMQILQAERT